MDAFFSCDWGTSRLRLRLVSGENAQVIEESILNQGIRATYQKWVDANKPDRVPFYYATLREALNQIDAAIQGHSSPLDIIISGMASSSIGMAELPYSQVPFPLRDQTIGVQEISVDNADSRRLLLVSGVSTSEDVMRGEEVTAMGVYKMLQSNPTRYTLVIPGTHSKHIDIVDGHIRDFQTYMTGDVYQALLSDTILSVNASDWNLSNDVYKEAFDRGIADANESAFLRTLFSFRGSVLAGTSPAEGVSARTSGFLIASELKHLDKTLPIVLCANGHLLTCYRYVFEKMGVDIRIVDPDEAIRMGHVMIWERYNGR